MNEIFIYRMVMDKIFFYRPELFRNENGDNNMKDLTLEEFFEEYEKAYIFKFDEQDNSHKKTQHFLFGTRIKTQIFGRINSNTHVFPGFFHPKY